MSATLRRALCRVRPRTASELRGWVGEVLEVDVPAAGLCDGHAAPMDYLAHAFFESGDVLVWANRGGGKTFYGAVATMLDLIFKPGISVRVLGGSLEQSARMHGYLEQLLDRPGLRELVSGRVTQRRVKLTNGSRVELLAQSQTSVRGQRVQKLRCDEVELFEPAIWDAAQFVTRSAWCGPVYARGTVEAFSTMHRPLGLMHRLVERSRSTGRPRLLQWCALDVLERCEADRDCEACALRASCGGRAKGDRGVRDADGYRGFLSVDDVAGQMSRVSRATFDSEMLGLKPSTSDAVYPSFEVGAHVRAVEADRSLVWIGGVDFGLRHPFVMLWAQLRPTERGVCVEVVDEYVQRERLLGEHLEAIERRGWPRPRWVGVDPAGRQRSCETGASAIDLLRRAGLGVRSRPTPLEAGIELVRGRLAPADGGVPGLAIAPRCERLIEAMASYHFDAARPGCAAPVKDGHDHAVDALRYMLVNLAGGGGRARTRAY